jgi:hypothetical protein
MKRTVTTNYGLAGGKLDATKHVARQQPGDDGYVNADMYNRPLDTWLSKNGHGHHPPLERR